MFKKSSKKFSPVSQVHPLGCSVACVASLCGINYQQALKLFEIPEHAWTRGYYCHEIVEALTKANFNYTFKKIDSKKNLKKINDTGAIIFVAPNLKYPSGHFLLKADIGWMNPWSNFPLMIPVQSAIEKEISGDISYIIYPKAFELY